MKTYITLPDGRLGRVLKDDGEMLHVLIAKFSQAGLRPTIVQVPR